MPRYFSAMSSSLLSASSGRVTPVLAAHALVQVFGEGFRQPVGQRLQHDGRVIVVGALEFGELLLDAEARGHGEGADPVGYPGFLRRDIVGEALVGAARGLLVLLAQVVPGHQHVAARCVAIDLDVVADPRGREQRRTRHLRAPSGLRSSFSGTPARPRRASSLPRRRPRPRGSPDRHRTVPRSGRTDPSRCKGTSFSSG